MKLHEVNCTSTECQHFGTCCHLPTEEWQSDGKTGIMIVGQGAGWQEEKKQRPWIGRAGQLLRTSLSDVAKKYGSVGVAFTNTVRCRPTDSEGKDRIPTPDEVGYCMEYLYKDIAKINPQVIVTAGGNASSYMGFSGHIGKVRGKFSSSTIGRNTHIIATYHPAGVLRNIGFKPAMIEDLTLAYRKVKELREMTDKNESQMDLFD